MATLLSCLHAFLTFAIALPHFFLCLLFLGSTTCLRLLRALLEGIFSSPLSILFVPFSSTLAPYFNWARKELLQRKLASSATLLDFLRTEELLRAPATPLTGASALTQHTVLQLQQAMQACNGPAILHHLHTAATHSVTLRDHADQSHLHEAMCEACRLVTERHAELGLPLKMVRDYLQDLRLFTGKSALCLSGGGSLAMAHVGVVRALHAQALLPRLISGTSGGAIVAAIVCLTKDSELQGILDAPGELVGPATLCSRLHGADAAVGLPPAPPGAIPIFFEPLQTQLLHYATLASSGAPNPSLVSAQTFQDTLHRELGEATFLSAFQRTGRVLLISVFSQHYTEGGLSSSASSGRPLILSYVSTPHVLLYSAVQASCALPWLMSPSILLAVNERGATVPYQPQGYAAIDGSLFSDLPTQEMSLTFHARHFIVSQCNPHVALFLAPHRNARQGDSPMAGLDAAIHLLDSAVTDRVAYLAQCGVLPAAVGRVLLPLTTQLYSAGSLNDSLQGVTVIPRGPYFTFLNAFQQPTQAAVVELARCGERAAWPHLGYIRDLTSLERCLVVCMQRLFAEMGEGGEGQAEAEAAAAAAEQQQGSSEVGLQGRAAQRHLGARRCRGRDNDPPAGSVYHSVPHAPPSSAGSSSSASLPPFPPLPVPPLPAPAEEASELP
jgi:predicted acylesterase/phospholipase RssA